MYRLTRSVQGSEEELFGKVMLLYGTTSDEPPRRALCEHPAISCAMAAWDTLSGTGR